MLHHWLDSHVEKQIILHDMNYWDNSEFIFNVFTGTFNSLTRVYKHKFPVFSFPEDLTNVILFPIFIAPFLSCIVIHWKCIQRCVSVESPGVIRVNGVKQFFQLLFIQSPIREERLELIKGELSIICRGNRDFSCTPHSFLTPQTVVSISTMGIYVTTS